MLNLIEYDPSKWTFDNKTQYWHQPFTVTPGIRGNYPLQHNHHAKWAHIKDTTRFGVGTVPGKRYLIKKIHTPVEFEMSTPLGYRGYYVKGQTYLGAHGYYMPGHFVHRPQRRARTLEYCGYHLESLNKVIAKLHRHRYAEGARAPKRCIRMHAGKYTGLTYDLKNIPPSEFPACVEFLHDLLQGPTKLAEAQMIQFLIKVLTSGQETLTLRLRELREAPKDFT